MKKTNENGKRCLVLYSIIIFLLVLIVLIVGECYYEKTGFDRIVRTNAAFLANIYFQTNSYRFYEFDENVSGDMRTDKWVDGIPVFKHGSSLLKEDDVKLLWMSFRERDLYYEKIFVESFNKKMKKLLKKKGSEREKGSS